jgi:uncharacterized protein YciI
MFVIIVNYVLPMAEVDRWLEEHRAFLKENYATGKFVASGPQVPRKGGVILARGGSRVELEKLLDSDPFKREGVAAYTVLEFAPNMTAPGFEAFIGND